MKPFGHCSLGVGRRACRSRCSTLLQEGDGFIAVSNESDILLSSLKKYLT